VPCAKAATPQAGLQRSNNTGMIETTSNAAIVQLKTIRRRGDARRPEWR
jgi:hypothetical protein